MKEKRNCVICNEEFIVDPNHYRQKNKKTCSAKCSAKLGFLNAPKSDINCKICNKTFTINTSKIQVDGNYCSSKCRKKRKLHKCEICNNDFRSDRSSTRFCSEKCRLVGINQNTISTICNCCEVEFERPTYTFAEGKRYFCSKKCAQRQFARENPARYGSNWSRIRERKVKKDDYTCSKCGEQNFEPYGLNVHHIIPIEVFENVNEAHYEENLETMCFKCHMEHQGKEVYEN